ncbi:hypothetical protein MLD38_007704 [Melastoma candidum]|uniref:Uncharacterized protein n=1 Tax=Melastoma candidum TaxID=119954 RepID=A0ACB9RT72_9MYRT|nr:hypothetical protein MLD38_007704 [Melastoma candidum]
MEERPTCSSSQAATPIPPQQRHHPQDEISLFLHQVLLRSSSSHPRRPDAHHTTFSSSSSSCTPASSSAAVAGYFFGSVAANACPSSVVGGGGVSENEGDEYDCESEGLEAFLEEVPAKPNPTRSSSKRSRTAEVHNLSEKRRRSRINEKMKALQSLIPNSNKTDKASMLDEAIEYLKQLQLQVQMLSMRNGLSLHPLSLPGVAAPIQLGDHLKMGFGEESTSLDINSGAHHNIDEPNARQTTPSGILQDRSIPSIINSELPFGLDYSSTSIQAHGRSFQLKLPSGSQEVMNRSIGDPPILGGASYPLRKSGLDIGSAAGGSMDSLPEGSGPSKA